MKLSKILSCAFALSASFLFASHALADTIKVGLMCPLTGTWASEGKGMKNILDLLTKNVNDAGGVRGQQIELIIEDDAGDPRSAALAAQKLVTNEVVAVIGTYGSAVTEASQNIYDESDVLQIATGSTSIRLSEKGLENFFRTSPRDDEQGIVAVDFVKNLGYNNIAVVHDSSSYAKGLADEVIAGLEKAGKKVVFFDAVVPKDRDHSAIITKINAANPELILFTGYYPEAGLILRQKHDMGINIPMMGCDAVNHPDLVKIAGNTAANGFIFLSPPTAQDLKSDEAKKFIQQYAQVHGSDPESTWAVLAGEAFNVLVEAMKKLPADKEINAENLSAYLKNDLGEFHGYTGVFSFDAKGDRVGAIYSLYMIDADGKFVLK